MKSRSLYRIVKELDERDASRFTKWVKSGGKKVPQYLKLFQRIRTIEVFSEGAMKKGIFKDTNTFVKYRSILIDRLIECFACSLGGDSKLNHIKAAINLGAFDQAAGLFSDELSNSVERSDFSYARYLLGIREEFLTDFNLDLLNSITDISSEEIETNFARIQHLIQIFKGAKSAFTLNTFRKKAIAEKSIQEAGKALLGSDLEVFWLRKIQIAALLLEEKYVMANELQAELSLGLDQDHLFLRSSQILREFYSGLAAALFLEDRAMSTRLMMKISKWESANQIERNLFLKTYISGAIDTGQVFHEYDFTQRGYELLRSNSDLFTPYEFVQKSYISLLSGLNCKKISFASICLEEIRSVPKTEWGQFSWQPEIMRLILSYEKGEIEEDWTYVSRSVSRSLAKIDHEFPRIIFQCVKDMVNQKSPSTVLEFAQTEVKRLKANPTEARQIRFFNLIFWLQSIIEKTSIAEIEKMNQEESLNKKFS